MLTTGRMESGRVEGRISGVRGLPHHTQLIAGERKVWDFAMVEQISWRRGYS